MNVAPETEYEATFQAGETGLVGTLALGLLDNQGAVTEALSTSDIIETPAGSGVYAATRTSPTDAGQYTLLWSLDGSTDPDQVSVDELTVTYTAPGPPVPPPGTDAYCTLADLQRVLQKPSPTMAEQDAMLRVIGEGAAEINWELSYTVDNPPPLTGTQEYAILTEVNLARAHELWNIEFRPSGLLTAGADTIPLLSAQDSWKRHALRLLPLKQQFGFA